MERLNSKLIVYLDGKLAAWLEAKAADGYKKSALVRRIVSDYAGKEAV